MVHVTAGAAASQNAPPGVAVARYDVTAAPPVLVGASHRTTRDRSPAVTDGVRGAPGTVRGVTAVGHAATAPSPPAFVPYTDTVYPVPFVNDSIVHDVASGAAVHDNPPGDVVAVNPVNAEPPSPPAVHDTSIVRFPGVAAVNCGAAGNVNGTTALLGALAAPAPTSLTPCTVNVYDVPFVNPVTVHDNGPVVHVQVRPPGDAVTRYDVIGRVPADPLAVHVTVADPAPSPTVLIDGADGAEA